MVSTAYRMGIRSDVGVTIVLYLQSNLIESMAIYYQHVGKENAERDFPETIGQENELQKFKLEDIEKHLIDFNLVEIPDIRDKIARLAPDGFQIWGIPSGAENVLKSMQTGDHLMLMPSKNFRYCGKVIHRFEGLNHELSSSLWGESKFAIIILLRGNWISYPWIEFREKFEFMANYRMQGNTMRLADKRLADSSFQTEDAFISHILPNLHSPPLGEVIEKEPLGPEGYVYAIKNPSFNGWIKVGRASDYDVRLKNYQTGDPHRAYEKIHHRYFSDRVQAETLAHNELKKLTSKWNGEWFYLRESQVINVIDSIP